MRRITLLLAGAGMLVLAPAATVAQERAVNQRIVVSDTVFNECTGESFTFEGTLHIVTRMSQDSAGGSHNGGTVTLHGKGVTASGAEYIIANATSSHGNFGVDAAGNRHYTGTFHTIRVGEDGTDEDAATLILLQATVNTNGETTASIDSFTADCR